MARDTYRYNREWDERRRYGRDRDDRGAWERAGDERRSWFGDEEAEARRRQDVRRGDYRGAGYDYQRGTYGRDWDRGNRYGQSQGAYGRGYDYDRDFERANRSARGAYDRDYVRGADTGDYYTGDYYERDYDRDYTPDYDRGAYRYGYGYAEPDVDNRDYPLGLGPTWTYPGPHTGRGPQGYQRSNERIVEDVNARLTRHGRLDASKIRVTAEGGEVTLEGTVDSRRAKRMAEDAAEDIPGVRDVHNRLRVQRET